MLHWLVLLCQRALAAPSGAVSEVELFGESGRAATLVSFSVCFACLSSH